jgi:hypothetical protein
MMKRSTTDDIHALTTAEIARQVGIHTERRRQIVNQRHSIYSTALKNGTTAGESLPIDADEKAARAHAKLLLNGAAPAFLSASEMDITLDKQLYREMRGIDIALKILSDKDLVARAAEAVEWAERHRDEWRNLARETTLTAIKLGALERAAAALLDQCPDIFAVNLPMGNILGGRPISETSVNELIAAASAAGVVTASEIRKAENVEH